ATLGLTTEGAGLLLIEVLRVAGEGKLIVTGRVGEVMRESATLTFSFWKSRAARFALEAGQFRDSDFHVHLPGGKQPREGASAGLAIALAFASLLADVALPDGLAALGEVTLRGRVLGVGRVAERLAAAQRAGVTHVLVPERNRPEIEGSPDRKLGAELTLSYVSEVGEAIGCVLPDLRPRQSQEADRA
ncbi:MAG: S16 family serine protease, partial [Planctomycetota bacterium]